MGGRRRGKICTAFPSLNSLLLVQINNPEKTAQSSDPWISGTMND